MKLNRIRKLLVVTILSGLALDAFAQAAPGGWSNGLSIKYVYAGRVGGRVSIGVYPPINGGSCSPGTTTFGSEMVLDMNDPYFVAMYAIVMKAASTGKTINAYTNGVCAPEGVLLTDILLNL